MYLFKIKKDRRNHFKGDSCLATLPFMVSKNKNHIGVRLKFYTDLKFRNCEYNELNQ